MSERECIRDGADQDAIDDLREELEATKQATKELIEAYEVRLDDFKRTNLMLNGQIRLMNSLLDASDREYKLLKAEVDRCHLVIEKFEAALAEEDGI